MNPKTEKLNDIGLDAIQKEVKRLQGRATTLQSKAIVRTDANVEKTGSVVNKIKISTQSIERMMTEELRPVMNETRNLVRETRWRTDIYAEATRSDTHANAMGILKSGTNVNAVCWIVINGRFPKTVRWDIEGSGEEYLGPMVKAIMQVITVTPELWAEDCPWGRVCETAHTVLWKGMQAILEAISDRHVITRVSQRLVDNHSARSYTTGCCCFPPRKNPRFIMILL